MASERMKLPKTEASEISKLPKTMASESTKLPKAVGSEGTKLPNTVISESTKLPKAMASEITKSKPTADKSPTETNKPKLKETPSTGGKKPTRNKTKPLHFWASTDVNKWLKKHGGHCHDLYGNLLLEQEVTGRTLIRINEFKLERMGISNSNHRNELMQHILRLRLKHETVELKNLDQKGSGFELPLPDTKHQSIKEKKQFVEKR
ncbi:hypothetical protein CHS0354_022168 [Potamilus streckersoni]|uniref:SAM domain-containing protein n=1 Tax=Potamilus streckersoni TaxID=2493646 RepID=A0AAE0RT59_9BIVA|nr:hypothetical protein CHS0354_022168 [Potamilus streckersoni]